MALFKLNLQPTYFKQGFFNVVVEFDRYVRSTDGPIRLRLGRDGPEIEGRIDRKANQNGTARVLGGAELRDWFQKNFESMNVVYVDLSDKEIMILDKDGK